MELGFRGQRLWDSLLVQDETLADESNPAREVALTACRTADRVDHLEERAALVDPVVEGRAGPMIHPVFGEVRQQAALFARLVAALRLPEMDASAKRPQRRQVRGVQQPSKLSSLDRARARSAG
jgi:hypothetical protein